ncbi:CAP domain-containing protein [Microbispora sp. RL4-1S]|uniref:CAP domain-containing protein n=1 Tax=Microbispora oryzae TaxID=2806554 RepID=A0A941AGU0_9ACTN|nr:CAP domain-containing protein [Microbispora oryzae]MBP2703315.1 CAP domain-containing protein [Microbispora oryzae]
MNRALGAVLCLGSVVALGASAVPAQAATQALQAGCRVATAKPHVGEDGKIRAAGSRAGCQVPARFRVRVLRAQPGPDRVAKSGAKVVRNGRVTLTVPCVPGVYYTYVTDYRGHTARSKPVRLTSCTPAPSPVPSASAAATPPASPVPSATPSSSGGSAAVGTAVENEVVRLTNVERAKAGCGPLRHDAKLHTAALGHSADMSAQNYFDHTSKDGRSFADRIKNAGYTFTAAAENIAKGYTNAQAVVQGWMNSSGHRQNILNCAYTDIGVGYSAAGGPYWTQDFGKH